jgi:hypothetical protein
MFQSGGRRRRGVLALRRSASDPEAPRFGSLAEAAEAECRRLHGLPHIGWPDAVGLGERLRGLSPAAILALIDAAERAAILRGRGGPEYRRGGEPWLLRAAGLVRE